MKKTFYFSLLCALWICTSGGCPHEHPCDNCQNGGIARGGGSNCYCDCPPGFSGDMCQNSSFTNKHRLHADIDTLGGVSYSYNPSDCFIHVYDNATDTVWIDGFDTYPTQDGFCFFRLYIGDHTTITNGSTFPIRGDNAIGSCWASYKPDGSNDAFMPDPSKSSTIKINDYYPGNVISGNFDFYGKSITTTAHITGWFEDYD